MASNHATILEALFQSAIDYAIIGLDNDGLITVWNEGAHRVIGWTEAEMIGQSIASIFTPEDRAQQVPQAELRNAVQSGRANDTRWHLKKDGGRFWASGEMMPLRDASNAHIGFLKILRDRSEQRRIEDERRKHDAQWRAIFEQMHEGFFIGEVVRDAAGRVNDFIFVEMNAAFEEQTGIVAATALGRTAQQVVSGLRDDTIAIYAQVVDTGEPAYFERSFPERDNRHFEARARRIGPDRFSLLFLDITARKAMEEAAHANAAKFRVFAQTLPNHVWTSAPDGHLDWFNERVYEYSGMLEGTLDGAGWGQIVHAEDLPKAMLAWSVALQTGATYEVEMKLRRADGVYRWHIARAVPIVDSDGSVTRWIGTNTDIEEQKTTAAALAHLNATLEQRITERTRELLEREAQLHQAQKMEAVGQLTGGIAHDFNNMLAVIMSALALTKRRLAAGNLHVEALLDASMDGAQRAASLTARLLTFSRQQPLAPRVLSINEFVLGMLDLLQRSLGAAIRIETAFSDDLWPVHMDASQLENAILNLAVNARDAMPDGGMLRIATSNEVLDSTYAAQNLETLAGEYVRIVVSDSGSGMTPAVVARAFDPFFTTKSVGKGTGLGLSQVFGFVKQSGGHVSIESTVGHGTTIRIFLPRYSGAVATAQTTAREQGELFIAPGNAVILLVEDEARLREVTTLGLRSLGYTVLEAADGGEALRLIEQHAHIRCLVTDVVMPGMSGHQLAAQALRLRPQLGVLFTSGYAPGDLEQRAELESHGHHRPLNLLAKPFNLDALAARIARTIAMVSAASEQQSNT